ncbi:MAG: MFS transporter [Sphingobacteriales bacterium]|jgi:UMF1 family MFS transporter|nr:MAG: MFS transporter [Sphingobacteriales bacterium]
MNIKNNIKSIKAWAMFDWANSAYSLVITSTIFPAYYTAITTTTIGNQTNDKVLFFGIQFVNTALSNYALATAYFIIALITPILTATADYHGNKKVFMKAFTWLGALACMGLFFFKINTLELGLILFGLAAIGYCGGVVFSNSYLPEIASPDKQDGVSAKGFAYGYVGSVILQIICFVFVLNNQWFDDKSFPVRLSFLLVGIWWIGFAYIPFSVLPKGSPNFNKLQKSNIRNGFDELKKVWQQIKTMTVVKKYLSAFFFYSMGVQTVMLIATNFGAKILLLSSSKLIVTILIIQLVAIAGAALMSKLSATYGNIKVLIWVLSIWMCVCIAAYYIQNEYQFYALAAIVGLIMGGIQSLSRSTFSKYLPLDIPDTASFFSFYDVTEKLAIVAGLFSFGLIEELTGNMRNSALFLVVFFVVGLIVLFSVLREEKKGFYGKNIS